MEQIWSPHFPLLPTPVWQVRNEEDGQQMMMMLVMMTMMMRMVRMVMGQKIMMMFHLGEEVSTVARSVAVFPVEVADRAAIGRLQDNIIMMNILMFMATFHILDPSSAVTPSQIVLPLFCFALHT